MILQLKAENTSPAISRSCHCSHHLALPRRSCQCWGPPMALYLSSYGKTLLLLHNGQGTGWVLLPSLSTRENNPQQHSSKVDIEYNSGTRVFLWDRSPLRRELQTFTDINENLVEKVFKNNIQRKRLFVQLLLSTTQHCLRTELMMIKMDTSHLTFTRLIKAYS